ncbi:MAG: hypothetical protein JNL32_04550 [Candidatus Kapabacteria bacterium]|nr:hypothetical protein [Candidatus Kapabacteria bacterium]
MAAKKQAKKSATPAAKKAAKPAAKKVAKPVAKKAAKPAAKKATKPVAKKATKPVAKKAAKPVAKKVTKPAAKKVAKPVAKKATKPVTKKVTKPVAKKAAKPVVKKAVKPVVKKAEKPAPKPVAKKVEKIVPAKPTPAPKAKPVNEKSAPAPVQPAPQAAAAQKPKGRTVVVKQAEIGSITSVGIQMATGIARPRKRKNKEDDARMEQLFEQTQAAPKGLAAKIEEAPVPIPNAGPYSTPEPVKPKANIRYSDKDLKEFATVITNEREKTLDELRMLKERLDDLTSYEASQETAVYSMHMAEQGSEAVEREKTYAQIQRMTDYLRKLDDAGKRIEDKTYGICRQCGILIAKQRLLAVPITTLSASWKLHQRCPVDGIDRVGKQ